MTRREVDLLAYEIKKFMEAWDTIGGKDSAMEIANAAARMVKHILADHPNIRAALDEGGLKAVDWL